MAKKYGDVVTLVRNSVLLNAIVAQSNVQPDGEHLTVLYLDPAFDSPIIGGSALQQAVSTAFAVPYKDGQANGWKDVEVLSETQVLQIETNDADAQAKNDAAWEKKLQDADAEADKLRGDLVTLGQQKLDLINQIAATKTVRFGLGEIVCTPGKSNDFPAVIIEPATAKGEVGADASGNAPQNVIVPGAVVLEFHGADGAQVLIQDVVGLFPPVPPAEEPKQ